MNFRKMILETLTSDKKSFKTQKFYKKTAIQFKNSIGLQWSFYISTAFYYSNFRLSQALLFFLLVDSSRL